MSPAHQSGRRRYAERAAAETVSNAPAVGHQRASDKRIQISAAEADAMIAREATPTQHELLVALQVAERDLAATYEALKHGTPVVSIGQWGRLHEVQRLLARAKGNA